MKLLILWLVLPQIQVITTYLSDSLAKWYEQEDLINYQKQILLNKILQALHMKGRPPMIRTSINENNFPSAMFTDNIPSGSFDGSVGHGEEKYMQIMVLADESM